MELLPHVTALIGRSVRARLKADKTFVSGVLYAVDPESGDIALLQPAADGGAQLQLVLGHAVESLVLDERTADYTLQNILDKARENSSLEHKNVGAQSEEDANKLSDQLRVFLDQHFIPHESVQQDGDCSTISVFGGAATLQFPFRTEDITCANEQILVRLQRLLASFNMQT